MKQPIRAVFFDLYGTLVVDQEMGRASEGWANRLREHLDSEIEPEQLFRAFWSEPMPFVDGGVTPFAQRLIGFCGEHGLELPPRRAVEIADELCTVWQSRLSLAEDAIPIIRSLADEYTVAVVSNFGHPPHVRRYLEAVEVSPLLDTLIVSGDYPFEKPDPRILLAACNEVGISPEETTYIGDSIVDYRAATAAGITPIQIRRRAKRVRWPDDGRPNPFSETDLELDRLVAGGSLIRIADLNEMPEALEKLGRQETPR